jgi:hypothetical protein
MHVFHLAAARNEEETLPTVRKIARIGQREAERGRMLGRRARGVAMVAGLDFVAGRADANGDELRAG